MCHLTGRRVAVLCGAFRPEAVTIGWKSPVLMTGFKAQPPLGQFSNLPRVDHRNAGRNKGTCIARCNGQAVRRSNGGDVAICAGNGQPRCACLSHQIRIGLSAAQTTFTWCGLLGRGSGLFPSQCLSWPSRRRYRIGKPAGVGSSADQRIAQLECRESAEVAISRPQFADPMGQAQRSDSGVVRQRAGHPTL